MNDETPPKVRHAWGGARPGAGRPKKIPYDAQKEYKRAKNKMPAEVRARLGDNPSPIDLMQALMEWHICKSVGPKPCRLRISWPLRACEGWADRSE